MDSLQLSGGVWRDHRPAECIPCSRSLVYVYGQDHLVLELSMIMVITVMCRLPMASNHSSKAVLVTSNLRLNLLLQRPIENIRARQHFQVVKKVGRTYVAAGARNPKKIVVFIQWCIM